MHNQKKTHWNTPVPIELNNKVEQAVNEGNHITKSEFIREAVRKQLKEQDWRPVQVKQNGAEQSLMNCFKDR